MVAQVVVLALLPALLLVAAGWDLASFTIPNVIPSVLAASFLALALATRMPPAELGWHALAGAIALLVSFVLFVRGYIGGGDAKLFTTIVLLLGGHDAFVYTLVSAVFGGVLTLALLSVRQVPLPRVLLWPWLLRLHDTKEGVPYGVALAAGALVLLPYTEIFRASVGG